MAVWIHGIFLHSDARVLPNCALQYMYDKADCQYSQLVMAARKAETETPGSNVSEARSKSAMVGTASQAKVASSDPPYKALIQQIVYLMSAITN